jgi:hypothetical protein
MNSNVSLPKKRTLELSISEDNVNDHLVVALDGFFRNLNILKPNETLTGVWLGPFNHITNTYPIHIDIERETEVTLIKF